MPSPQKTKSRVLPIIWIAAFTAVLAGLVPSAVIAGRDNNTFMLSVIIPAMVVLLVLDGILIGLMYKTKTR